ncbi:bifunctional aminoglycoside phosphotransferase/ATP-binding protein [Azorhizobium oxalatiphilum]|nr:AAA family ATPase [Azorhizobium oxalatiphilum]
MSDDHVVEDQSTVFAFLADPATHGGEAPVTRIDTHGAAVFLAGDHAFKVKRAVDFPFMDFSTLEKRRAACEGEIAINRPNAPDLYLDALPVTESDGHLAIGGNGRVIEWLVHMRRFDEAQTLDRLAEAGPFDLATLSDLASAVAQAHRRAPAMPDGFDAFAALAEIAADNIASFSAAPDLFPPAEVEALTAATLTALSTYRPLLQRREESGFVRHCHGDLHLRNIALIEGRPVLFDAIEFNPQLATCDLLYDLAFLLMDLWQRERHADANLVLNRYLWAMDDEAHYEGLAALPLFISLRAGIRAKVGVPTLAHLTGESRADAEGKVRAYFDAARAFLTPVPPVLVAVGGLSGTGKSRLGARLAPTLGRAPGAVVLRSDVERKLINGVGEMERLPPSAYGPGSADAVYARLRHRARIALDAGAAVVVDAVHARAQERKAIEDIAETRPFLGLWLTAAIETLKARVAARSNDASDATPDVITEQMTYDLGPMTWQEIDVSRDSEAAEAVVTSWQKTIRKE